MLILKRRIDEEIQIGPNISVKILSVSDNQVKLGISAPADVEIFRSELLEKIKMSMQEAKKASKQTVVDHTKLKINKIKK